ncbi:MAG: hypothetical protein RBU37_11085 [Myxococcota bacterium]|jgi:hypothetical protein|nr:hypothetical protein [Myxococcota bacterium]
MMRCHRTALLTFSVLSLLSTSLFASPSLENDGGIDGSAGFASRTFSTGASAAYFNPARLFEGEDGLSLAFVAAADLLDIRLDPRPDGSDVGSSIERARAATTGGDSERLYFRPLPTDDLRQERGSADPTRGRYYLGVGGKLGLLDDLLAVGFLALLPVGSFQRVSPFYVDEREQYFSNSLHYELLGDRMDAASFAFAAALRPIPSTVLGVGVTMATSSTANTAIYVPDAADQERAQVNGAVDISTTFVPHFAVSWRPIDELWLSAVLHLEQQNTIGGTSELQFFDYDYPEGQSALNQRFAFSHAFLPLRAAIAARFDSAPSGDGLDWSIGAELSWWQWSSYVDRHNERPSMAFSDIFRPALGARLGLGGHELVLDGSYLVSPIPEQTGRSNYVDNDRVGLSLGWRWRLPFFDGMMRVGAQFSSQILLERRHSKRAASPDPVIDEYPDSVDVRSGEAISESFGFQSNNPGFPGYASEGVLLKGLLVLELVLDGAPD